jgi:hypothetical protein
LPDPFRIDLPPESLQAMADEIERRVRERLGANNSPPWPEWMTVRVAASYMGTSESAVRNLIARRRLIAHQEAPGC